MRTDETQDDAAGSTAAPATAGPSDWREKLRTSRFGTIGVLALTTLLVMVGAYFVQRPTDETGDVTAVSVSGEKLGPPPAVGAPAQDFVARTIDGKPVRLSDYQGRPVWLLFGATWCSSCRAEVADVEAAYRQAKARGVEIISVYLSEDTPTVKDYSSTTGLTYLQVPDPQTDVASAYRVMGIPAHYFIDRQGKIASIQIGALDRSTMDASLKTISG